MEVSTHETLLVATYNVAFRCQTLEADKYASEFPTVRRMRRAHAPRWGQNAAEFMAGIGVHVLGVQEMCRGNGGRFARFMSCVAEATTNEKHEYCAYQPDAVGVPMDGVEGELEVTSFKTPILYRTDLGDVVPLEHLVGLAPPFRAAAAIYITRFRLVFMNAWLDHSGRDPIAGFRSLEPSLCRALQGRRVHRMMIAMDANDQGTPPLLVNESGVSREFVLLGHTLRQKGKACRSCSEGNGFQHFGDYIFDSGADETTSDVYMPELPNGWTSTTQLMSDHLPIVAEKRVEVVHGAEA